MKELLNGFYGINVYLPLSGLSRRWRRFSRQLRGKDGGLLQQVRLPPIAWRDCVGHGAVKVYEADKANGNIRISELAVISRIATACEDGTRLFEIGTFDGRTTINLAKASPSGCAVFTLDLRPEMETEYALARGERHMVEKAVSGARLIRYREAGDPAAARVTQLYGDSATFDFTPYADSCSLVFVDGSHAYDYALSDTRAAMQMVRPGGVILWHDYGIWEGVTRALEEIEDQQGLGLRNIAGTSLVYWQKPA